MAVDDDAAAIAEFEPDHAVAGQVAIAWRTTGFEFGNQRRQRRVGGPTEVGVAHLRGTIGTEMSITTHRVALCAVLIVLLHGCGTKGALYLPPPPDKPGQAEAARK